jgi:hypothetical protein
MITIVARFLGIGGAGIVLLAYFLTQSGSLNAAHWLFPGLNLLGAALILFSLKFEPNWPSIVLETAWVFVSVYGLYKAFFAPALH